MLETNSETVIAPTGNLIGEASVESQSTAQKSPFDAGAFRSYSLLGVGVHALTYSDLCQQVDAWTFQGTTAKFCCYVNPHSIVMSHSDSDFRAATSAADLVMADGAGIILASKILGLPIHKRVCGPTSMLAVIEYGIDKDFKHYFFGASEECLEKLSSNIKGKFPNAAIVGTESPPYRAVSEEENDAMIRRINESGANMLWVGLGAPKQEKWIAQNLDKLLNVNVVFGVGAAFDYHAGVVKWAPTWIRSIGLEWAYRFVQQPRRLLKRNINSLVFLSRVLKSRLLGRK